MKREAMKLLRFQGIRDITPPGLDGHKYRVHFEVGSRDDGGFKGEASHEFDVEVSGTLQAVWNQSDADVEQSSATAATSYVMTLASEDRLDIIPPLVLNTYSAPKLPPKEPVTTPGATFPIHHPAKATSVRSGIYFLSEGISKIRDEINALTTHLWGGRVLLLSQERALFDMYKQAQSEEHFRNRVQSLAGIATDLDPELLEQQAQKAWDANSGTLILLALALERLCSRSKADEIVEVLKNLNYLRQGYPAHGDNAKRHLDAYVFFGLPYPIVDFGNAWERKSVG
ncbi:MAG: hypothetical protein GKR94_04825 [Gammaproteobacteria bacterium]|nr:hypothetical protein [Gammaproteobacteria bacterium]